MIATRAGKRWWGRLWPTAVLALAAAVVTSGLSDTVGATHDGLFHLYRGAALFDALREGVAWPRWLPDFAFGYGQPVFAFYGAGSYYLIAAGRLAGLSLSAAYVVAWYLGYLVSGQFVYAIARRHGPRWSAALAGVAFILLPYRLVNAHVRGAYAEHWGLAFTAVLALVTMQLAARPTRGRVASVALAWAALLFVHHLSAMVAILVVLALLLAERTPSRVAWTRMGGAFALGTALTAAYWLPLLVESSLVGLGQTFSTDAWHQFLTPVLSSVSSGFVYRYAGNPSAPGAYPVSWGEALILISAAALLVARPRATQTRRLAVLLVASLALWALQTTLSAPVWAALPPLGYLQFPWRLMGHLGLMVALLLAIVADGAVGRDARRWGRAAVLVGVSAALMVASLWHVPRAHVLLPGDDWVQHMWDHDRAIGQAGATWTAEFMPTWVTVDRSAMPGPPVPSDRPPPVALPEGARLSVVSAAPWSMEAEVSLPEAARLSWHVFHYPGQVARADSQPMAVEPYTSLGLASAMVPVGVHRVSWGVGRADYVTAATVTSALTAGLVAAWLVEHRRTLAVAGALVVSGLMAGLLLSSPGQQPVTPTWAAFGDELSLSGSQFQQVARPGETIDVTLFWLTQRTPERDLKAFVHLVGPDGAVVAQHDGDPVGGYTVTSRMVGGEITRETRRLATPRDLPPGEYTIRVGLYTWPEMQNLAVTDTDLPFQVIGTVQVRP